MSCMRLPGVHKRGVLIYAVRIGATSLRYTRRGAPVGILLGEIVGVAKNR